MVSVLEDLGITVREVSIPLVNHAGTIYSAFGDVEAAITHLPHLMRNPHAYGQVARVRLATGLLAPSYVSKWGDRVGRAAVRREVLNALDGCDILVAPTMPTAAPRIPEQTMEQSSGSNALNGFDLYRPYLVPFALAGVPALSLCCGFAENGLPVAVQLASKPYMDELVLRVAHAYQTATEWHTHYPLIT
jgi:aspartyl-tRNA(Asn)/glutamyl-tRNA(Gln) amidotransferase subunit A